MIAGAAGGAASVSVGLLGDSPACDGVTPGAGAVVARGRGLLRDAGHRASTRQGWRPARVAAGESA